MANAQSKFIKHVLVEKGELDRLRQRQLRDYNPELGVMAKLQEEIFGALRRKDLDDTQKLNLISLAQHRFDHLKEETNTLTGSNVSAAAPAVAAPAPAVKAEPKKEPKEEPKEMGPLVDLDTLQVHKNYRDRAAKFLEQINPEVISKNEQNELVVNGQAVPGSSVNKLYKALFTSNGSAKTTGMPELLNGLRQLNIGSDELVSVPIKKAYGAAAKQPVKEARPVKGKRPAGKNLPIVSAKAEPEQSAHGYTLLPKRPRILYL